MSARAYSPKEVAVVIGGFPITHFGPDTFIEVERNEDAATLSVGVDGEAALTFNKNLSGKLTLTIMQTSESNDILMGIQTAFENLKTLVPFMVKNLNGRDTHVGSKSWPMKTPKMTYGKNAGTVQWVFETDKLVSFVGGATVL